MKPARIHITGPSGAGSTTLGHALADRLDFPVHDSDDYIWRPTTPPYRERRPDEDAARLMQELFADRSDWIFSGLLMGWGDRFIPLLDLVVYLYASEQCRAERLRERETRHFGLASVTAGGWRHEETEEFLEWASHYDDGTQEGSTLEKHNVWLARLPCSVLRLDSSRPRAELVEAIVQRLKSLQDTLPDWFEGREVAS